MKRSLLTNFVKGAILVLGLLICAGGHNSLMAAQHQNQRAKKDVKSNTSHVEYRKFPCPSLGYDLACAISLPASYQKDPNRRYPVVFFLHGLFNDEHDWESRGIQDSLDELRASGRVGEYIVAIPYGASSFYLNGKDGTRYEDAIVKDFIPFVDHTYRTTANASSRLIEGISMGGYGALMIAFKHPEMFAGVAAHCAALFSELPPPPKNTEDTRGRFRYELATRIYGNPIDKEFFQANNPLELAKKNTSAIRKLKIYFDIGKQDRYGFDVGNNQLDASLTEAGIAHQYYLVDGEHGWSFMLKRTAPAFQFCWQVINNTK